MELVPEIQAVRLAVREVKSKMVRDLLRASSTSIVVRSVYSYVDVLNNKALIAVIAACDDCNCYLHPILV